MGDRPVFELTTKPPSGSHSTYTNKLGQGRTMRIADPVKPGIVASTVSEL